MKSIILIFLFIGIVFSTIDIENSKQRRDITSNKYHFIFKEKAPIHAKKSHIEHLSKYLTGENKIVRHFEIGSSFSGFTVEVNDASEFPMSAQIESETIKYVTREKTVRIASQDVINTDSPICVIQKDVTWGLNRVVQQKDVHYDGNYIYKTNSVDSILDNVNTADNDRSPVIYIVDTGIYVQHNEFGGRAIFGANFVDTKNTDCNGHGTHCSGTAAGSTYGIAKNATLVAVKVLDCEGYGTSGSIIDGIAWLVKDARKRARPAVASMSLGTVGGRDKVIEDAVRAAIKEGVTFSVAAGNDDENACLSSPSAVNEAIVVGATQQDDSRAYFSNFGTCVTLFAPGHYIKSAWIGSTSATKTISGTSMATPHVSGAIAVYLRDNPEATPENVKQYLQSIATKDAINLSCGDNKFSAKTTDSSILASTCKSTPNELLYVPCE